VETAAGGRCPVTKGVGDSDGPVSGETIVGRGRALDGETERGSKQ